MNTNYWLSWYHDPEHVFKSSVPHWITGTTPDNKQTVCAVAQAATPYTAKEVIAKAYQPYLSPQAIIWRFCESKPDSWEPFNDRFVKQDWMEWRNLLDES